MSAGQAKGAGKAPEEADGAIAGDANTAQPSRELLAKIGQLRSRIQLGVGQVVLAMMNLPRYRHQTLGDLAHLVIEPLLRDRVAFAYRSAPGTDGELRAVEANMAGFAIWASVSDTVDARITEQVKAGVFPVRLAAEDWASGDNAWLLDVIAGDRQAATAVLANFRQVAGERTIKVHPMVGRLIEPAVLERMRGGVE